MLFWSIIIDSRQDCRSTDRDGLSSATDEEVPLFFGRERNKRYIHTCFPVYSTLIYLFFELLT